MANRIDYIGDLQGRDRVSYNGIYLTYKYFDTPLYIIYYMLGGAQREVNLVSNAYISKKKTIFFR